MFTLGHFCFLKRFLFAYEYARERGRERVGEGESWTNYELKNHLHPLEQEVD